MQHNSAYRGKKSSSWRQGFAAGGAVLASAVGGSALALPTETTLHIFCSSTGCADGSIPVGQLYFDGQGNLYGTTDIGGVTGGVGGATGNGVVFKISPEGAYKVLYSFKGGSDGANPYAGVIADGAGNLYGVTQFGGTNGGEGGSLGNGVVFKLSPGGIETVLYSLCQEQQSPYPGYPNCVDGSSPLGRLYSDAQGNLYGTTLWGGLQTGVGGPPPNSSSAQTGQGNGLVFKLSPWGSYSVLHAFTGLSTIDGSNPWAGLIADSSGNLYGTTFGGGQPGVSNVGNGVVFKLSPSPNSYNVLYQFTGYADGSAPYAPLYLDSKGNLYGTTAGGGDAYGLSGYGVAFELSPNGRETVLHTFNGTSDGGTPGGGLIEDCSGNLYGVTTQGGITTGAVCTANEGCGVVFELSPKGKSYSYQVLYQFTGGNDGANPLPTLIADSQGNLYGTATLGGNLGAQTPGGTSGNGVVFKLSGTGFNASCHN